MRKINEANRKYYELIDGKLKFNRSKFVKETAFFNKEGKFARSTSRSVPYESLKYIRDEGIDFDSWFDKMQAEADRLLVKLQNDIAMSNEYIDVDAEIVEDFDYKPTVDKKPKKLRTYEVFDENNKPIFMYREKIDYNWGLSEKAQYRIYEAYMKANEFIEKVNYVVGEKMLFPFTTNLDNKHGYESVVRQMRRIEDMLNVNLGLFSDTDKPLKFEAINDGWINARVKLFLREQATETKNDIINAFTEQVGSYTDTSDPEQLLSLNLLEKFTKTIRETDDLDFLSFMRSYNPSLHYTLYKIYESGGFEAINSEMKFITERLLSA